MSWSETEPFRLLNHFFADLHSMPRQVSFDIIQLLLSGPFHDIFSNLDERDTFGDFEKRQRALNRVITKGMLNIEEAALRRRRQTLTSSQPSPNAALSIVNAETPATHRCLNHPDDRIAKWSFHCPPSMSKRLRTRPLTGCLIYLKAPTHHLTIAGMPQMNGNARLKRKGEGKTIFPNEVDWQNF